MEIGLKLLSEVTIFNKYCKYLPEQQRRETWEELIQRNKEMHIKKFPSLVDKIEEAYKLVLDKKILPSMRSLQFAGKPIEINQARIFNCCFLPIDDYKSFSETMYLLLSGCGVGYSVQFSHIAKLPEINKSLKSRRYVIEDSIIGWADSIKVLLKSYLKGTPKPIFDFGDIRPKGALLITAGGKAPGAEPLKRCLFEIEQILESKNTGEKLKSIECHSIVCLIADAVLSGGIRRSATISLFSFDDEDMVGCKSGNWWEINPHYARANNSAVISRNRITKEEFDVFWERIKASGSGEPGISWTNNPEYGFNPCFRGDMKIKTSEGYKPLESLENQEVELVNSDNKIVKGTVWCSGEKDIYDILTWNNKHIYCTKDHVFLTTDNKETKAEDLVGKRLMPNYDINQEITEYVKLGFIQGDGGLGRLRSEDHLGVEVNIGDRDEDILEIFNYPIVKDKTFYLTGYKELLKQLKFSDKSLPEREFPTNFINWQDKDKLMFLKGLYSANGSIITGHRISFKTTCKNLVNQLRENLEYAGINSYITTNKQKEVEFSNGNYICKESYDINISIYEDILKFAIKIGFVHKYKHDALRNLILEKAPKVRSVTYKEFGKVYDFSIQEGDNHWGIVEGVIAHNCHEVSLRPYSFCNLTEINGSNIENEEDFYNRCKSASFISTLQASYTDFVYLRPIWKEHTDKDALIGVGITGIASNTIDNSWIKKGAKVVKDTNQEISTLIGINKAARCTVIKPSGTTSCVLGTSSGIHAWYNNYYIRRLRIGKNESLFTYLSIYHPEILEDDIFKSKEQSIISLPIKAPENALLRNENVIDFLERVKLYNTDWVKAGHRSGANLNNGSVTKGDDLDVNPMKAKELSNMRSKGSDEAIMLKASWPLSIERGLEIMKSDEYLEITPKNVRLRKKYLTKIERSRKSRKSDIS
jgi:ribonucleotide reductase alpha subunit